VGVSLDPRGFALCHVRRGGGDVAELAHCRYVPVPSDEALEDALRDAVHAARAESARAVFVLGPGAYALRVVDAPAVAREEQRAAARWSIQELVDFDASDAAVEVFEVPAAIHREGTASRLFVVAAPAEEIRRCVALASAAGLDLAAIDITELALRNVAALHPAEAGGAAAVLLAEQGLITVSRDGALFVARWIGVSERDVDDAVAKPGGEEEEVRDEALDALVLEIQRSLDYYEHELRQLPARTVLLPPLAHGGATIEAFLSEQLGLTIDWLDLNQLLTAPEPLEPELQRRCLAAVGGALRADEAPA
jgi:MSHA biogenesis protein MshI